MTHEKYPAFCRFAQILRLWSIPSEKKCEKNLAVLKSLINFTSRIQSAQTYK